MSEKLKICRIINNNVAMSSDSGNEAIYMGSGLCYGKRVGDYFEKNKVEKVFTLNNDYQKNSFYDLSNQIPPEIFDYTADVISFVEQQSDIKFSSTSFLGLADHFSLAINRKKEGGKLKNTMLNEIKRFYPKEYNLGLLIVKRLEELTGLNLGEDEAGFISIHLINDSAVDNASNGADKVKLIENVVRIVSDYFEIQLDEESFYYQRFITHLKYFSSRVLDGAERQLSGDDFYFKMSRIQYPEIYKCVEIIREYVKYNYDIEISQEEEGYLMIHLSGLIRSTKKKG